MAWETGLEAGVVLVSAALAAASIQNAITYLVDREWTAVVFLTLAAASSIWYGGLFLLAIRGGFAS